MIKRNPKDTHVAVLMGGWSAEREVSLSSGEGCAAALRRAGFNVTPIDVQRETIFSVLQDLRPDVAFNALHGKWGEDGCASALLETLQIPYTHSGVLASSLAMNKEKSKHLFHEAGIPVAESLLVEIEVAATQHPMALPYVLKPVDEGSSVGVHIVTEQSNGPAAIILEQRNLFGSHVMAERFIPGRELTCAVMGDVALGVIDIISKVGFYDYRAKYSPGGSQHILAGRHSQGCLPEVPAIFASSPPGAGLPRGQPRRFPLRRHARAGGRADPFGNQYAAGNDGNLAGSRARGAFRTFI